MSTQSTTRLSLNLGTRVARWPAYLLAVLCPGAGHLYIRQWKRSLSWAALCGVTVVFLSPGTLFAATSITEPMVITILRLENATFADIAFPFTILILSVIDCYTHATLDDEMV